MKALWSHMHEWVGTDKRWWSRDTAEEVRWGGEQHSAIHYNNNIHSVGEEMANSVGYKLAERQGSTRAFTDVTPTMPPEYFSVESTDQMRNPATFCDYLMTQVLLWVGGPTAIWYFLNCKCLHLFF